MNRTILIFALLAPAYCQAQTQISATDALKLAAQNRPSLASSRLRIEQVRLSARAFSATPPLNLTVGASSRNEIGATDQDFALTQEIDIFGKKRALEKVGEVEVQLAMSTYRQEASQLQSEVLTAFAIAVSARHQMNVATELLIVAEGLLNATQRRFDEGKVAELQVTRATIECERAKQSKELKNADYQAAMTRLASYLAIPVGDLNVIPDATIEPISSPNIMDRPDILAIKAEVAKAIAEAKFAKAASRPEFNLQIVRSPWSNDRGYFVGRAQLSWNLLNYGKSKNEMKAAKVKAEAANKALEDAIATAENELAAVQIELESRQSRIKSYEAILASAKDLVAKSQKGFIEGFGTQVDVLEATRALREVEQELVEAREQLSLAVIKQYEVSGYLYEVLN